MRQGGVRHAVVCGREWCGMPLFADTRPPNARTNEGTPHPDEVQIAQTTSQPRTETSRNFISSTKPTGSNWKYLP